MASEKDRPKHLQLVAPRASTKVEQQIEREMLQPRKVHPDYREVAPQHDTYQCERFPKALMLDHTMHFAQLESSKDVRDIASVLPKQGGDVLLLAVPCCADGFALTKPELEAYILYLARCLKIMR